MLVIQYSIQYISYDEKIEVRVSSGGMILLEAVLENRWLCRWWANDPIFLIFNVSNKEENLPTKLQQIPLPASNEF